MIILTTYQNQHKISFMIYKFYGKKYSLKASCQISWQSPKKITWKSFNAQNKLVKTGLIDKEGSDSEINYQELVSFDYLDNYNIDIIVHKVAFAGDKLKGINILNKLTLKELADLSYLAPDQQPQDISLAEAFMDKYANAKHYVCCDTTFHHSIEPSRRILALSKSLLDTGIKNYGSRGLIFEGICIKLGNLVNKKQSKGKWIIAYLDDNETTLCAIKNSKSYYVSSSHLFNELPSLKHPGLTDPNLALYMANNLIPDSKNLLKELSSTNLKAMTNGDCDKLASILTSDETNAKMASEYYVSSISNAITKMGNLLSGIDGVIFTGNEGLTNPLLRELVCNKLEWIGIALSSKSNHENLYKLHRKSSKIQLFTLNSEPESAMLSQLIERL